MYYDTEDNESIKLVYENVSDRWRIGVVFDPNSGHRQISYVNGICTFKGGNHVNHVLDQVVGGLTKMINDKHKGITVKPVHIRDNITVFIDAVIEDPSFSSQTKEELTTMQNAYNWIVKSAFGFI